jgi:4-amino-4-deoxy-L-arabinose transferase-like glycosyltransferase
MLLLIGGAVVLATLLRQIGDQPVVYDALGYVWLSQIFAAGQIDVEALRTNGWGIRTYGYPVFLVPWGLLTGYDLGSMPWVVFPVQLALHLAASWLFARRVASAFGSDRLGRLTLVLVALNPYALILAGMLLTDLPSASLIAVAVALLLPPQTGQSARGVLRDGILALFAFALAAEIRPANAILIPVGGALWGIRWWLAVRWRLGQIAGGLLLVSVAASLPLLPQVFLNWRVFGQPHPFVTQSLYQQQIELGLGNLKYATVLIPGQPSNPQVNYRNPFLTTSPDLLTFAQANPLGLAATVAFHIFALFDQDYPYPYIRETDPWHRWPLSLLNYLWLWSVAVGLGVCWRSWWRPGTRIAVCTLSLTIGAYLLVYLAPQIENRYGLPLFTLLGPVAAGGLLAVRCWVRTRAWGAVLGAGASALAIVGACAWLSVWLQAQAPALAMFRELLRPPGLEVPLARFDEPPPDRWVIEQRQTYRVRVTNLGERTWYAERPAELYLHVMFVKPGDPEVIDTRVEVRLPIEHQVPPGGQLEMDATVMAPRKEGEYLLRQQLEFSKDRGMSPSQPFDAPVVVDERRSGGRSSRR